MSKRRRRNLINALGKIIVLIGTIILILFISHLLKMNLLPMKYIVIIIAILLFIYLIMYILILGKKIKTSLKIFANIIIIILSIIFALGIVYVDRTITFLDRINDEVLQKEEYYLMVLKENKITELSNLKNKKIGFYIGGNSKNVESAVNTLTEQIEFEENDFDDVQLLFDALQNKQVNAILINGSVRTIMNEDYQYLTQMVEELTVINVPIETKDIVKIVDVTNTPFNIFIIGSDSFGKIDKVSNSDVNMLVTINPKTSQILLTSIPRDYYVEIYNTNGGMDKLTHAGYYGVETSVKTVENLLDTEINYYARVNFTTVIDIVDLIGGIEVYSDYTFSEHAFFKYKFKKGYNKLNGEQALAFARERYSFKGGDRVRGQNQQKVIAAIVNKLTSSTSLISKYTEFLSAIEKSFQTNLDNQSITKLVKLQLNKMPKWQMINQSLNGKDSSAFTYSYPKKELYVMKPDEETINEAKLKINEILNAK